MNYHKMMQEIRLENNILQKDIAKVLGISRYTYSHYETNDNIIPINHLVEFCDYFNISVDYIFELNKKNLYNNSIKNVAKLKSGKRLKEFRKDNKLTQEKLANILNVSRTTITEYEKGTNVIATPFLYTICSKYNISADYLLGKIDEPIYLKKC